MGVVGVEESTGASGGRGLSVYPPVYRLGSVGVWLRRSLHLGILHGTPVLLRLQALRTPLLTRVMKAAALLGLEDFYTLLVISLLWFVDARLGRSLTYVMALAFYLSGYIKNQLCLPRPPAPPIVPLEHCSDWALPSNHALVGVVVSWYIFFYTWLQHEASGASVALLFALVLVWSLFMMVARLYLGVHSPADVVCSGVIGCLLLAFWLQCDLAFDRFLSSSPHCAWVVLVLAACALCVHPDPSPLNSVLMETVVVVGAAVGMVLAEGLLPPVHRQQVGVAFSPGGVCQAVVCFVVGVAVLMCCKEGGKLASRWALHLLCWLLGVRFIYQRRLTELSWQHVHLSPDFKVLDEDERGREKAKASVLSGWMWLEGGEECFNSFMPVRFISYVMVGLVAVKLGPLLLHSTTF